uniref:RDD family protein n=1 Tax=Herbidospora sakaeratensis TaxID=564415 RepID=UPI000A001860|nr:RDD family protein [Herbidospora sakaeratensis]
MSDVPRPDVVTGDAVALDVPLAQLPIRVVAFLLDLIVQILLLVGAMLLIAFALGDIDESLATALIIASFVAVLVGYPVTFETLSRGRSLGKMALGLRVVADDGGPERFRQAFFRGLTAVVEIYMLTGAPAVICALVNQKGKRLGDLFGGTVVISERAPKETGAPPEMPPQLAAWAATLELTGLTDDLAAVSRQYLTRLPQLSPHAAHDMGLRIASQVSARVQPPPPPGVPPYAYLAAVLAERRRREMARFSQRRQGQL